MKKVISVLILIAVSVFTVFPVNAADRVLRVHTFELDDFDEIEINNSVGSIDLRLVEGNEIRVEVDIEAQDRYFGREVDVDDIEVGVRMRGDKLILTIDEDKIKAHWYIEMPAVANIEIDMGVGEIDVEIEASNLEVNLGVGEVDNSRTVVASASEGYGDGKFSIDVDVGVGDVTVELI
jgi:hypothetical protein